MSVKLGLVTLLASTTIATAALGAGCRTIPFRFFPEQNDSVTASSTMDARGCFHRYYSGATHTLTSFAVATRPSHGTLTTAGSIQFHYMPKPGYKRPGQLRGPHLRNEPRRQGLLHHHL